MTECGACAAPRRPSDPPGSRCGTRPNSWYGRPPTRRRARGTTVPDVGALVRAAATGDEQAWSELVDRYGGLVWSVARAHRLPPADAADVVQTTWLRLVEHLDRLQDPAHVGSWLATTARRESLRALRLSARQVPVPEDALPEHDSGARVETALLAEERDRQLWSAFASLSERCQTLLRVLLADPPPSYQEVSAALALPIGSIGPTRARCLARLHQLAQEAGLDREQGGVGGT